MNELDRKIIIELSRGGEPVFLMAMIFVDYLMFEREKKQFDSPQEFELYCKIRMIANKLNDLNNIYHKNKTK